MDLEETALLPASDLGTKRFAELAIMSICHDETVQRIKAKGLLRQFRILFLARCNLDERAYRPNDLSCELALPFSGIDLKKRRRIKVMLGKERGDMKLPST